MSCYDDNVSASSIDGSKDMKMLWDFLVDVLIKVWNTSMSHGCHRNKYCSDVEDSLEYLKHPGEVPL